MEKISIVISAYNEEKKIEDCLESVKDIASEIIFVDNSSTDNTVKIAEKYTDKIFVRQNHLMLNVNKNYGFTKATGDWILCLDADERVSPELAKEIGNWKLEIGNSRMSGFWIPRKNIIFGKWMQHTGWHPDHQLRLFRKGHGKFEEEHVHEMVKINGETAYLKNLIIHYNFETISQFLHKHMNIYAPNEAKQLIKKGYQFKWQDVLRMPMKEFLSRFFAQEGYKDGFHGLALSLLMAFYHLMIFGYLWEREKFIDIEKDMLVSAKEELNKVEHDMSFWYHKEQLKTMNNPLKKTFYHLLKKT